MIEGRRIKLIPIDVEMIDSLLVSDECFYERYGLKNDGGEFLNPSPGYLHKIKDRQLAHPEEYPLAVDQLIVLNETNIVIGTIYFKSLPVKGSVEIGYGMSPQYEGNGYMSEALLLMIIVGKKYGITKITADTTIDNIKSQKVLKRNGFILDRIEGNMMWFFRAI